jgi:PAS domain S-box-containing protein
LSVQKRAASELHQPVTLGDAELARANEELRKEIAERKEAEERLRLNQLELRRLTDAIPIQIQVLRADGVVLYVNQSVLDYTGLTFKDVQKEDFRSRVFHPDDVGRLREQRRQALTRPISFENEQRALGKDGKYRWFLIRYNPLLDERGRIIQWYAAGTDITERKQAEEKLRHVIDTIPTLAWCNLPDGTNEFLNKNWHDYTGLSPEESDGWGWQAAFHQEDLPALMEKWKGMLVSGEPGEIEARLRRSDGVYRWFLIRAEPFRNDAGEIVRWYGTSTDIDDRKRAEEQLQRSEAFLAEGQRLNLTGSFSWKVATGEITWSEQLYRLYEFKIGVPVTLELIRTRVHPEDLTLLEKMIEQAHSAINDFEWHYRLLMPDNSVKYLHAVAHARRDQNGQLEYIATVQDVTKQRSSEEALAKARLEFAQVARVMSMATLTASIAHEVNQPLAGIVTNASTCLRMLSSDPPNIEGARETARRTIRDGNRASDVITRLRTLFSKKDATFEPLNLNEAAREVIALCLSELQRNRVVLRTELGADLPAVSGDRVQLQQVILNLLRNGSEAMHTIDDQPRELLIRTERDAPDSVRVSVKDVGLGLEPHALEKLFEAFYTTKADGMGIGLSISHSIIEGHHGRLWAMPNDGPGATFCFSVPCTSKSSTSEGSKAAAMDAA